MIKSLHIENYALISRLDINLHEGFSVITGETGAGKSIILGAIGLLKGQRADMRSIKTGEKRCVVEAVFNISNHEFQQFFDDNDLDYDPQECVVRRELTAAGKSRAFINDTPVTAALLKELGDKLLDVHSQHQNLLLNNEGFQIEVLDIIAADTPLLADYRQAYRQWRNLVAELQEAEEAAKRSHEDEDYWRFQYQQLAEAALNDEQEQETLEQEAEILEHAEDIREHLYAAQNLIDGNSSDEGISTLSMLKQAIASLNHISDRYQQAESLAERIDSCYIELKDVADELEAASTGVEDNPERLMQVQERLNLIYTLQRKHHVDTLAELMAIRDDFGRKLDAADNSEERIAELKKQAGEAFTKAAGLADQLTKARTQAARKIETLMVEHLQELGMPNVRFSIQIGSDQERLMPSGADKVTFLFSANKNGELQNVSKVASGGEIARVMLSLKALIASAVQLPTIIFDEIDTGVSGKIAEKMAHIMNQMGSNGRQVISITHLPQIASLGSHHYKVFKEDDDDATHTHIVELDPQQRVEEIAHMLSGSELTEAALQNARVLLGC